MDAGPVLLINPEIVFVILVLVDLLAVLMFQDVHFCLVVELSVPDTEVAKQDRISADVTWAGVLLKIALPQTLRLTQKIVNLDFVYLI